MLRILVLRLVLRFVINRRKPDLVVGAASTPTMERWRIFKTKQFGLYAHRFLRDDADEELHDHPWASFSWILSGGYVELTENGKNIHEAGTIKYRAATYRHRIQMSPDHQNAITLFIVGKKVREWGFWHDGSFLKAKK